MSVTLTRCWDSTNTKFVYTSASCDDDYDECWDTSTKTHGVYCDSTFYPRCWNSTSKNFDCVVGDDCCAGCPILPGSCNSSYTMTVSGATAFCSFLNTTKTITWGLHNGSYRYWSSDQIFSVTCSSGQWSVTASGGQCTYIGTSTASSEECPDDLPPITIILQLPSQDPATATIT